MNNEIIKLTKISKKFSGSNRDIVVLKNINLKINRGELVSLTGPSGSGKSTLMNIVGCLDTPSKGTYLLNQRDVGKLDEEQLAGIRNQEIGFIFQQFHLLPRSTALENVALPLKYASVQRAEQLSRAEEVLNKVGLRDRLSHKPTELSGGEQQRVAIARALVNSPSILFADEPTGNLDSKTGKEVLEIFKELNGKGQTIVVITHEKEIAKQSQRTLTIKDGEIESDSIN